MQILVKEGENTDLQAGLRSDLGATKAPHYEYSRSAIQAKVDTLLGLSMPHGLTVRYALKANPHPEIAKMMDASGVHFDASSSYEAADLLAQGIKGERISLSSQQSPHNLGEFLEVGGLFVASSINQLKMFLATPGHPGTVGVRINIDVGHGHNKRTSTGGKSSSFGIWHEYIEEVLSLVEARGVSIDRVHIHIGSGADISVWQEVMVKSLKVVEQFKDAVSLDIGGGFKVHRYAGEKEADMQTISVMFAEELRGFEERTGRQLHLEIEPGSYLVAGAGTLVAYVDDVVDTGTGGYRFLRLNTGMNDFLRSSMYGARHKIEVVNGASEEEDYVVVGHNCESGDILSPAEGNPEELETRRLKRAERGDEVRIYDTGAYCASMRAKGYNSFPDAFEIMVA